MGVGGGDGGMEVMAERKQKSTYLKRNSRGALPHNFSTNFHLFQLKCFAILDSTTT